MENSILYIEPLYIRASSETAIPEVKRIIAAFNSKIVMDTTLEGALKQIFANGNEKTPDDFEIPGDLEVPELPQTPEMPQEPSGGQSTENQTTEEAIKQANQLYEQAQEALKNGSLSEYERLINELGRILRELQ